LTQITADFTQICADFFWIDLHSLRELIELICGNLREICGNPRQRFAVS